MFGLWVCQVEWYARRLAGQKSETTIEKYMCGTLNSKEVSILAPSTLYLNSTL